MATPNPSNDMLSAAEFTVSAAKKELGKTLDYSSNSLEDLDILIEHVKKHFLNLKTEGKLTEQTVQRASVSIGGYLGEVIRRKHGGTWIAKNAVMKTLVITNEEFSPILYVFERLTKNSNYSLEGYWSKIDQALLQQNSIGTNQPVSETAGANLSSIAGKGNNRSLVIGGIVVVAVLCLVGITAITIYSNIKATNAFKAKTNTFLVEAERLNQMTEQGVTYQEFGSQLIEVKSAYASIDSWPSSYRDEKQAFDNAINGWQYTLDIWEIGWEDPSRNFGTSIIALIDDASVEKIAQYTGIDYSTAASIVLDKWIELLMGRASTYFEAGKAGVK